MPFAVFVDAVEGLVDAEPSVRVADVVEVPVDAEPGIDGEQIVHAVMAISRVVPPEMDGSVDDSFHFAQAVDLPDGYFPVDPDGLQGGCLQHSWDDFPDQYSC